jgi:hypothetical protein
MRRYRKADLAYLESMPAAQADARRFVHEAQSDLIATTRAVGRAQRRNTVTITPVGKPHEGFVRRIFFEMLDHNLRSGLPMKVVMNGEIVPEERARRIVEYARRNGFLPPADADPNL